MPATMDVLEVIAEPTRRRILDHVRDHERSVGELVQLTGMHQPGVSRHLRVLRDAGLVDVRADAQRRLYRLRPEPLAELDTWLEPYRVHWAGRLDALERHLDRTNPPKNPSPKSPKSPKSPPPSERPTAPDTVETVDIANRADAPTVKTARTAKGAKSTRDTSPATRQRPPRPRTTPSQEDTP
jgi:DNA-binding transcriptional ArsR family regulator